MADDRGGIERELGGIQEALKNITVQLTEAAQSRRGMYQEIARGRVEILELRNKVDNVQSVVDNLTPHVLDYQKMKARGWGLLVGVAGAGGGIGASLQSMIAWFRGHS